MAEPWHQQQFLSGLGPMQSLAPRLLQAFLQGLEQKLMVTEVMEANLHVSTLREVAHSIKGSAGQVCCFELAEAAAVLEQVCTESAEWQDVQTPWQDVVAKAQRAMKSIHGYLAEQS